MCLKEHAGGQEVSRGSCFERLQPRRARRHGGDELVVVNRRDEHVPSDALRLPPAEVLDDALAEPPPREQPQPRKQLRLLQDAEQQVLYIATACIHSMLA